MIDHKHKFIFSHIPKCGGVSIRVALGGPGPSKGGEGIGHIKFAALKKKYPNKFDNYFTFAFVRSPWDRMVSAYSFLYSGGMLPWDCEASKKIQKYKTFQNFIYSDYFKNINTVHFFNMHDFTHDSSGQYSLDFIGKFENLQEDFNTICDKIGIPTRQLPHKNKSSHKHYTEYYDDETRQIVAEKYAKDIEYFGYEFGG